MLEDNAAPCLTHKCRFFCSLASTAVSDMLERLYSGKLTIKEVQFMNKKKAQVEKLCKADGQNNAEDVVEHLKLRNFECNAFERHKSQLVAFCRQISGLRIEGNSVQCLSYMFEGCGNGPEPDSFYAPNWIASN